MPLTPYGPTPTLLSASNYPQLPKLRNETHIVLFSLKLFQFEWLWLYFIVLFRPYLNGFAPLQPRRVSSVLGRHGRCSRWLMCYLDIYQEARARGDSHQHLEQYRQDLKKYSVVPAVLLFLGATPVCRYSVVSWGTPWYRGNLMKPP